MKRLNIPSYLMRTKWFIILIVAIVLMIFGRTVVTPALTKTAVVLGVGIDYSPENSEFKVSTQSIITPTSSSDSGGEPLYETYSATGKTISAALDDISRKMGLTVSLSHCNILFVSDELLKLDHTELIYPLTGKYSLPEHALLVTGDKCPDELLAMFVGTTVSAPYFLQSTLRNSEGTDGMIRTTIKDLLARSMSRSEANAIPYIVSKKMDAPPISTQGEVKDVYEFDLKKSFVFNHKDSHILEEELSEVLALYLSDSTRGALNYVDEKGRTVEFNILDKNVSKKVKGRTISAEMELSVELLDVQFFNSDKVLDGADEVILKSAEGLAKELKERLIKAFELSKELNIDFLGLQAKAYQSVGRTLEKDCLKTLEFKPEVKIQVKETA